jgi:hypothetical protein
MDHRFQSIAALAAEQHSVVALTQLIDAGVSPSMRSRWVGTGLLQRLGPRSFAVSGSELTWLARLTAATFDHDGHGFVAGRSAARMMRLDGFTGDQLELIAPRSARGRQRGGPARTTARPIPSRDLQVIEGLRVVRAERLILDAPLFGFDRAEIENAIDSAIRLRLVSEQRLRTRVLADHRSGINGSRLLVDALVDAGGESRLERWFLRICREAGVDRPHTQMTYRDGSRIIARVDAEFPGGLIVEVAGHGTHSSRQQIQADEQRRTELTLRGKRVISFTYDDVRYRPVWVVAKLREAVRVSA